MSLGRMSHAIFGVASALGSSLHGWPFGALANYMLRSFVGILNILVTTGFLPCAMCILSLNLNWSTVYFPAGITRGLEVGNACCQHGPRHVTLDPLTCGLLRLSAVQQWAAAVMKSHAQTCKVLPHVSNYGGNLDDLNISSPERQQFEAHCVKCLAMNGSVSGLAWTAHVKLLTGQILTLVWKFWEDWLAYRQGGCKLCGFA